MPPLLPKQEGICDVEGGKLIQREDDKEEIVRYRLDLYNKVTAPLVDYYQNQGILRDFSVLGGVKQLLPSFIEFMKK